MSLYAVRWHDFITHALAARNWGPSKKQTEKGLAQATVWAGSIWKWEPHPNKEKGAGWKPKTTNKAKLTKMTSYEVNPEVQAARVIDLSAKAKLGD